MKIKTFKILIAFAVLISALSANAVAFEENLFSGPENREQRTIDRMIDSLGLSKTQEDDIRVQREGQQVKMKELRAEIREKVGELKEELNKQEINRRKINRMVDNVVSLRGEMFRLRVDGIIAMKEILTPEQYEKLKTQMDMMKEKFKGRREKNRF